MTLDQNLEPVSWSIFCQTAPHLYVRVLKAELPSLRLSLLFALLTSFLSNELHTHASVSAGQPGSFSLRTGVVCVPSAELAPSPVVCSANSTWLPGLGPAVTICYRCPVSTSGWTGRCLGGLRAHQKRRIRSRPRLCLCPAHCREPNVTLTGRNPILMAHPRHFFQPPNLLTTHRSGRAQRFPLLSPGPLLWAEDIP